MKSFTPAFAAAVAGGVTTLAWCWRLARVDGVSLGFTDHDEDLVVAGLTYAAATGFSPTSLESPIGLAPSNLEASGALASAALTEADLAAGRYDNAVVSLLRVDWTNPAAYALIRQGYLGQVRRGAMGFSAELRGLASPLDQEVGRLFTRSCAWTLGDARCTVDLAASGRHGAGTITAIDGPYQLKASGLGAFASAAFAYGKLTFTSGAMAGVAFDVGASILVGAVTTLSLIPYAEPPDMAVGDSLTVVVGCDLSIDACAKTFANALNFGGFPYMPGNDYAVAYGTPGAQNDGKVVV